MKHLAIGIVLFGLVGCGGGGGGAIPNTSVEDSPRSPSITFPRSGPQHYGSEGLPRQSASNAHQMPIYHDGRNLMVGIDQGAGIGNLPRATTRGATTVRHGRLNDGAGVAVLARYLSATVDDPALKWKSAPIVRFGGDGDQDDYERVIRAVQLVNTILPDNRKMRIASDGPSEDPGSGIYFGFIAEHDFGGSHWGATFNSNSAPGNQITHSGIVINKAYTGNGDRQATILLAHELLHALGMFGGTGHVSPDLDSILEGGNRIYDEAQGIPQPLSLLYPADREAMRVLYQRLADGDSPTDFGPWASTSQHVAGHSEHAAFGVALRNGYAEPWAYGLRPTTALANNQSLTGSATWSGTLLGFTPRAAPVAGDAAIGVNLATMNGTADFTALESWPANTAPSAPGTGAQWLDGDLHYTIAVDGNTFRQIGGDDGVVTGIFVGNHHQGAAGTVERTDLAAAFGAARDTR